jgi:hypothetical protein
MNSTSSSIPTGSNNGMNNSSTSSGNSNNNVIWNGNGSGGGGVLLFEQIVEYRFRHSTQGVLFVLFGNGDASFYPVNEQTKGTSPVSAATMLTTEGRSEGVGRKLKTGALHFYYYLIFFYRRRFKWYPLQCSTPIDNFSREQ